MEARKITANFIPGMRMANGNMEWACICTASGEFDIQPVNERIIWVYGAIYGEENQAVF